jgi:hypothetical protein
MLDNKEEELQGIIRKVNQIERRRRMGRMKMKLRRVQ